jgi:hypothetical protein
MLMKGHFDGKYIDEMGGGGYSMIVAEILTDWHWKMEK